MARRTPDFYLAGDRTVTYNEKEAVLKFEEPSLFENVSGCTWEVSTLHEDGYWTRIFTFYTTKASIGPYQVAEIFEARWQKHNPYNNIDELFTDYWSYEH